MSREFDDTVHNIPNYYCQETQGRRRNAKTPNGRREWADSYENLKNHRDFKLPSYPSCDCAYQNLTKADRKNMGLTAVSDQHLEPKGQSRKSRKHKSPGPLVFPKNEKHLLDPCSHDFEPPEMSHCVDHCPGNSMEKSLRKKTKEETAHECPEIVEDKGVSRPERRRRRYKENSRTQKCPDEVDNLKDAVQLIREKRFIRPRNLPTSKVYSKIRQEEDSDLDNDEEEQNRLLERELAMISCGEPRAHSKRIVKTPETNTSATETSAVEEMEERCQRNVRDGLLNDNKRLQQTNEYSASSEASAFENDENPDDTLRHSAHIDENSSHYINSLQALRWRYLNVIQHDLNRLCELEQFLHSLTTKNFKSGDARDPGKERPITRGPPLR